MTVEGMGIVEPQAEGPGNGALRPLLSLRNVSKQFPGQWALKGVNLDLHAGRIHGLVGQNGSGKSTLIKTLAGYHSPEPGYDAWVEGRPFHLGSASSAEHAGIRFIHQNLGLILDLNTVDNLALGRGYRSRWWIPLRRQAHLARELINRLGFDFDVTVPVARLRPIERSMVAFARAFQSSAGRPPSIVVLDEPTEALSQPEVTHLFTAIRQIVARGAAALYVSHQLDEVLSISDEVTVLRDGVVTAQRSSKELEHDELVRLIVGRQIEQKSAPEAAALGNFVLRVDGLTGATTSNLSFDLRAGEVVGVAGIVGSGREEIAYLLGGARRPASGTIELPGRLRSPYGPSQALDAGVVFVAADRETESAILTLTCRENLTMGHVDTRGPLRWLDIGRERTMARAWFDRLQVEPPEPDRPLATLSGGNQQKVVLARALRRKPSVLVLDEPVQGVDIGAKASIFLQLRSAAKAGIGVLIASSTAEDLVATCDRVLVMRRGRLIAQLSREESTVPRILEESLRPEAPATPKQASS